MYKNFLIPLILSCYLIAIGCAAVVVGAGAGAGVYTDINGELKRSYQATFDKTIQACTDTLKRLKIKTTEKTNDGIKTRINARCTDGTPVTIKVVMIGPRINEVSVRSGIIGVWDKKVSELIHATIAQRLQ